jgi:Holliday junction resolvase RusA-like endonuclease
MNAHTMPSYVDRPFGVPPDIVLDVPLCPSVNKTRKIDWENHKGFVKWRDQADKHFTLNKQRLRNKFIAGRYQITVVLNESKCAIDPDNSVKHLHDLMKRYGLIMDDSKKYCRGIHIVFGEAPEGARIILTPCE